MATYLRTIAVRSSALAAGPDWGRWRQHAEGWTVYACVSCRDIIAGRLSKPSQLAFRVFVTEGASYDWPRECVELPLKNLA